MIKRQKTITGLDIGSSKISAVSAECNSAGDFRIVAHATQASRGVAQGEIVNLNEAVDSVSRTMASLRTKTPSGPGDIYVNIGGGTVKGSRSKGMVPISLRGREVTKADIDRCANAAGTIHLPFDREIIHRIVRNFSIDDQPSVKNPLGLFASRLACEVYMITAGINHIQNIYKCIGDAGFDAKGVFYTGVADGTSLLDKEEKEAGTVLVDMGNSITQVSIFFEGGLADLEIIPIGTEMIKQDFRNNKESAGLIEKMRSRFDDFLNSGGAISGVVVTGGACFIDGMLEFLEEQLSYRVKMGVIKGASRDIFGIDNMKLATAAGLARYAYENYEKKRIEERNIPRNLYIKVVDIFNDYF